jgi:gluconolactonase
MLKTFTRVMACAFAVTVSAGCQTMTDMKTRMMGHTYESGGTIERLDPALDALLAPGTKVERLAGQFDWSEGPTWLKSENSVVFSDVPMNQIYKWNATEGLSVYMYPSGYTGTTARAGEPGSNGLTTDTQGRLVLAEHGDRRIARRETDGKKTTLADNYDGKKFNSPNDLVYDSKGNLFFTDPPYGLEGRLSDPKKELDFQGVYRLSAAGELTLLARDLKFPNGLALSPDEKTLYVAVSDPENAIWMAYDLSADGKVSNGRVFFNATSMVPDKSRPGLPDGMKVDKDGNLWATGPGGVLIFNPKGKHLGTIMTGHNTGNCAWGDDGSTLYITSDMWLLRVKTKTKGKEW